MLEQAKYEAVWEHPAYRVVSPGAHAVPKFLEVADPQRGQTVRDLGCGTGRAGLMLRECGLEVTQYDFAVNCRDEECADLPFVLHDLNVPIEGPPADYALCCDVLEHIPPGEVERVLLNVLRAGRRVFLQISCVPDHGGALIGETLHLTVQPHDWWADKLKELYARVLWSEDQGAQCQFYVTAFMNANEFSERSALNVSHDTVYTNIRANLERRYAEVAPHQLQETPLMVLAGGPSLADDAEEIVARRRAGEMVVTMNGTHQWCADHGITSSIHVMCDARAFNARFVTQPFPRCRYLIGSQCDPAVAGSIPFDQVLLWHSAEGTAELLIEWDRAHGLERDHYPVFGGGTVLLRTLPLLMMLGFHKFEIFGFDSSLRGDEHHAYAQPENDKRLVVTVRHGGREFKCHPWMVSQAGDFLKVLKVIGAHIDLIVRGDGLISHIVARAAEDS